MNFLTTYRHRLINLNNSNRSLCLLRTQTTSDLDVSGLNFLHHTNAFDYIRNLLEGKKSQPLLPLVDARSEASNKISSQLKKIQRRDKWLQEESGSQDLCLGWPFVEGKFLDGTIVRAPLLLFPVSLLEQNGNWLLQSRGEEIWIFNKTFQLAFSHYNKVPLANLPEPEAEDFPNEAVTFRTKLFEFLRDNHYTLNFNRELFEDKLISFDSKSSSELDQQLSVGQLKLQAQAVLGFFPYAGSWLVSDYEVLEEKGKASMEDFFRSKVEMPLTGIKEEQLFTSLPMDGSQEAAIRSIRQGNSLVVQGPPGTGKSQLIVNIISDFCARGKKVLLVSQKRAALEVVQQRLEKLNLAPFSALIHDLRTERPVLYAQIAQQIEHTEIYESENNKLDTVFLEREFVSSSRSIDQTLEKLSRFKKALYDTSRFGISAKELYLNTKRSDGGNTLQAFSHEFNFPAAQAFARQLALLLPRARKYFHPEYPFHQRKNFSKAAHQDLQDIRKGLGLFSEAKVALEALLKTIPDFSEEQLSVCFTNRKNIQRITSEAEEVWVYLQLALQYKKAEYASFEKIVERLSVVFSQKIPKLSKMDLNVLDAEFQKAQQTQSSFLGTLHWSISGSSEVKTILKKLNFSFKELDKLNLIYQYWKLRVSTIEKLQEHKWLPSLDSEASQEDFLQWKKTVESILQLKEILLSHESVWQKTHWKKCSAQAFLFPFQLLETVLLQYAKIRTSLLYWWEEAQLQRWMFDCEETILSELLEKDFAVLKETDTFLLELKPAELSVLKRYAQIENTKPEDFLNDIQSAWIQELEKEYPELAQASTGTLDFLEKELQLAIETKQRLSLSILQLRLKENTYRHAEYNRLNNRTTYRELLHQTTKRKKIWPVRKLMQEFHEELFRLIPCWMASPETVSALFPAEEYFDLVIFDEASQCFTEKGLPSVYRGKQCVIAGDSKQLRPGDLYRVRWEEEDESLEEEAESLLELAGHYLPQALLKYHYRSSKRELIEFSNHHFYQGKLELIPEYGNRAQALFYHNVPGRWRKQQNREEAEKVVITVKGLMDRGERNIGIVTFNFPQAELIQELLEEKVRTEHWNLPEDLFVKNLENVQGDERDIIVFSIAYAPDEKGKLQLRFGSLNQEDGPNRLNVAVSRARKEIHVVTSILPSQLETERLESQGPKLLKEYLQFVWNASQGNLNFTARPLREQANWYLNAKLKDATWKVADVPLADLQQGNTLLLTDDDQLFAKSEKEFFGLVPMALKQKGWQVERKYSRGYWLGS